jgi:NADP-dependent aldehyde dehydrogenase
VAEAKAALASVAAQHMLTRGIADAYHAGCNRLSQHPALTTEMSPTDGTDTATPAFFSTTGADWLANADLGHEVFGPSGLLIRVKDDSEMLQIAKSLEGQLTCTLQMDPADAKQARTLLPILERKAGRILANGFPTGVEVAGAMVHGGPYPASTNFGATSVGTLAIRRFLRPVCYQDIPDEVMPAV